MFGDKIASNPSKSSEIPIFCVVFMDFLVFMDFPSSEYDSIKHLSGVYGFPQICHPLSYDQVTRLSYDEETEMWRRVEAKVDFFLSLDWTSDGDLDVDGAGWRWSRVSDRIKHHLWSEC